ncbi:MAG: hypothetical protein KJO77_09090 [Bacteroidia bacterium]|nr:hypothetical protein [Bacteroidia bacterium]
MMNKNKRLYKILLVVPFLLLIPLIGMQFTSEINWSIGDFLIMGALLIGVGLMIELVMRKFPKGEKRWLFVALIIIVFLLIWAELAVGIFGTPFAGS